MRSLLAAILLLISAAPVLANDLTVGWISRLPEIDYVWNSSNPSVEGWPAEGSAVTWRAHVRSWFDDAKDVAYVWKLDGALIAQGTVHVEPNATTAIDLQQPWTFTRHRLSLEIDSNHVVAEESETNNRLEVYTDALAVGFWVEQSFYDHFRAHQRELGIGSTSFENWAQRMIGFYNDMAAMAVYPETPAGVHDRWRLQKVVVVPDGALPLVPPHHAQRGNEPAVSLTQPDSSDRNVDLQWGFPASKVSAYTSYSNAAIENPFYIPTVILHELGHARYLTDVYAFDVRRNVDHVVLIPGIPAYNPLFSTPEQGLMNDNYTFIDRYSAMALNRIAGHRAIAGNFNDPENVGSFLNDLPTQNELTILDQNGVPVAGADVQLFRSEPDGHDAWYATRYDATPDLHLTSDALGRLLVGRSPFAPDGVVVNGWHGSNVVVIVRVEKDGLVRWGYLESRLFNLAYWRGETAFAKHEVVLHARPCSSSGPRLTAPAWDAAPAQPFVRLAWSAVDGATGYTLFTAIAGQPIRRRLTTSLTEAVVPLAGNVYWWVEATLPTCPSVRSDLRRVKMPAPPKRRAAH